MHPLEHIRRQFPDIFGEEDDPLSRGYVVKYESGRVTYVRAARTGTARRARRVERRAPNANEKKD